MSVALPSFSTWLSARAAHIEGVLDRDMPRAALIPARLHDAMRYAVLGGGKRVRAALVYAAGYGCAPGHQVEPAIARALDCCAAAVELVHAYSLVHDDLPCMDNDTLRRGQPTVHVQFDEATALLAGDALQPLAFDFLAQMPIEAERVVKATQALALASGSLGMAGGQAIDLASVGKTLTVPELEFMHIHKTGALIRAAAMLGARCGNGLSVAELARIDVFAKAVGLAFQVVDDVLDAEAPTATLGKTAGKDAQQGKPTYVSAMGITQAKALAGELRQQALQAIAPFGERAARLAQLADFIVLRKF